MPAGRPTKYTPELIEEICLLLQKGKTLTKICEQEDMPCFATVNTWLLKYDEFLELYRKSRLIQADYRAQEIYDLPFECERLGLDAAYTKLKMDGAKWAASKGNPKLYGDSTQIKHADAEGNKLEGVDVSFTPSKNSDT